MSDCIEWLWSRNEKGYGSMRYLGKMEKVHRVAYCLNKGVSIESISGLVVMHSCDNRGCCNPEHLLLGTQADNIKDMVSKGRQRGNQNQWGSDNHRYKHGLRAKGEKKG